MLVDWAWAARGDARCDRARFLPQICAQTPHVPEDFMPGAPEYAALVSGTLAGRAGQPEIPEAPGVRATQRRQLEVALPWAQRALGLAPLDGPRADQSRSM